MPSPTLRIAQKSKHQGDDWWKWSVWLEGRDEDLDRVRSVTYHLHPTFPDPTPKVSNRRSKFLLKSGGWGEFEIRAAVRLRDEKTLQLRHWLRLTYDDAPSGAHAPAEEEPAAAEPWRGPTKSPPARHVFVSYAASDADRAIAIADELAHHGVNVWMRGSSATPSPDWEGTVRDHARKSDAAIVLLSGEPTAWMRREIALFGEEGTTIIPVLLDRKVAIPKDLRGYEPVRLTVGEEALDLSPLLDEIRNRPFGE